MSIFAMIRSAMKSNAVTANPDKTITYGTHGRLEIPALSISVPLYDATGNQAQGIVDQQNSAAIFRHGSQMMIADHVDQGNFFRLGQAIVGQTIAFITYENKVSEKYRCVEVQYGHIQCTSAGNRLFDWSWESIKEKNPGGLTIYTCLGFRKGDIQDVTITYWQPILTAEISHE